MTVDYSKEKVVRAASIELRKKHSALDWSAKVDDLIRLEGLEQGTYSPTRDRFSLASAIRAVQKSVKALISVKDQVILMSEDLHHAKEAFAKGHELGHSTLEWHREILYICDEHDLNQSTRDQMEWEANTFASEVLLPEPLMAKLYGQYATSMDTVLHLRNLSGASIESCAIAFANHHPGVCVLLILAPTQDKDGKPQLSIKNKVVSRAAVKSSLGSLIKVQDFPAEHVLYTSSRGDGVGSSLIHMKSDPPTKKYKVSTLNNKYRVMALCYED